MNAAPLLITEQGGNATHVGLVAAFLGSGSRSRLE